MEEKLHNLIPPTPIFNVISDDVILILSSSVPTVSTVTLFDSANAATKGSIPTYTWTIPASDFPASNPKLIVNSVQYTFVGTSTAASFPADLASVSPVSTTITGYTSGTNKIYYTSSATNVFGTISIGGSTYTPVITNTMGGTGVTVTLMNMNYNQFVSGLNMMGGFFFDTMDVLAQSISQVVQPITVTRFKDVFGTQFSEMIIPALNLNANQAGALGIKIFMPADGNNTLAYNVGANETVQLVIKARAYDTLKWFDPNAIHMEPYTSQPQGKETLIPRNYYYIAENVIENDTQMKSI